VYYADDVTKQQYSSTVLAPEGELVNMRDFKVRGGW
jgi:hypothetical protein